MEILRTEHLTKTYGTGEVQVKALKDVSFALEKGEFAAVVGESGSGKTTLLNCIGGLDTPTSGKVLLDGQDIFSMKENKRTVFRRQNIGFIFRISNWCRNWMWSRISFSRCFWTTRNRINSGWKRF